MLLIGAHKLAVWCYLADFKSNYSVFSWPSHFVHHFKSKEQGFFKRFTLEVYAILQRSFVNTLF